jgi:hypothetical protein
MGGKCERKLEREKQREIDGIKSSHKLPEIKAKWVREE